MFASCDLVHIRAVVVGEFESAPLQFVGHHPTSRGGSFRALPFVEHVPQRRLLGLVDADAASPSLRLDLALDFRLHDVAEDVGVERIQLPAAVAKIADEPAVPQVLLLANPCITRKPTAYLSSTGSSTPRTVPFSLAIRTRAGCWFQKSRR
jgi:hypothetical protein